MKPITDLFQILLSDPGPLGLFVAFLLVLTAWQVCKTTGEAAGALWVGLAWLRARFIRLTVWRLAGAMLFALPVWWMRGAVVEGVQWIEYAASPLYIADTSAATLAAYEAELSRHCSPDELQIVKQRTRETAAKVGCSPLAIYEVAYSECGLDPFRVREDGIAAGWIQFTRAGAVGVTTLDAVKDACRRRDVSKIMDWSEAYLVGRAAGVPLVDAAGVYVCVFAPAYVGKDDGQVLYSGYGRAEYDLNAGLDGYYVKTRDDGRRQIFRSSAAMDGKITKGDLRLALEAKKARLVGREKK